MGNIGILGVDKDGEEWYQVTLGGAQGNHPALGKVIGPSFKGSEMADVVERITNTFVQLRVDGESFAQTLERTGLEPFKNNVYATSGMSV